jgi:hypothetical protein
MITAGSANDAVENTGRSSADPTLGPPAVGAPGLAPPRYALAIERMSMRPEPSPPPWLAAPDDAPDEDDALGDAAAWARG